MESTSMPVRGLRGVALAGQLVAVWLFAGLIAPRPLLLEMGIYDDCFPIQDMVQGSQGVQRIYRAAGVEDRFWTEIHPGPHAFAGNKAFEFFRRYL